MTMGELDNYLNTKIENNEQFIEFSFYELRIKCSLSKKDSELFIKLARNKLENSGYRTYLSGDFYIFNDKKYIVRENQLLVAVK